MKKSALSLLIAISVLIVSCSKQNTEELAAPNYDGTWTGTTSQGKSFSFTVSNGSITSLNIGYTLSGNCSYLPAGVQMTFYSPQTINGNTFSIPGDTKITGNFSSAKAANGTFSVNFTGVTGGCNATASGNWTAGK